MGYSTTSIDISTALKKSILWTVKSASNKGYFFSSGWRKVCMIKSAEIRDNKRVIHFDLKNGDFVEVEKR